MGRMKIGGRAWYLCSTLLYSTLLYSTLLYSTCTVPTWYAYVAWFSHQPQGNSIALPPLIQTGTSNTSILQSNSSDESDIYYLVLGTYYSVHRYRAKWYIVILVLVTCVRRGPLFSREVPVPWKLSDKKVLVYKKVTPNKMLSGFGFDMSMSTK